MSDSNAVNQHYLDRLVALAQTSGVEATEDILCGNGTKLIAKGSSIDARTQARLLQHKLRKPLEASTRVINGVATRPIDEVAHKLLHQHALLAKLCDAQCVTEVERAFQNLRLSAPLESLLSVYAAQGHGHLEHAVGVSLLAGALLTTVDASHSLPTIILAGLMHDIGELYIDPSLLTQASSLQVDQWKHIAAHPVVASKLLHELPGAGPAVAQAVLHHHEREDGFGYPQGLRGACLPVPGQVLAMAEMLMGLIESGDHSGGQAAIALKLIPGEFNRQLLQRVTQAARSSVDSAQGKAPLDPTPAQKLIDQANAQARQLRELMTLTAGVESRTTSRSAALCELLNQVQDRCGRIRQAFCSTGLDFAQASELCARLAPIEPALQEEITSVLREVDWRLRELQRELELRSQRLSAEESSAVRAAMSVARQSLEPAKPEAEVTLPPENVALAA